MYNPASAARPSSRLLLGRRLPPTEQMLHRAGKGVPTARGLDYLRDRRFAGHFDANRRFLRADGPAR